MKSRERKRGVKGPWTCYTRREGGREGAIEPGDGPFPARAPNPGNKYGEEVKPQISDTRRSRRSLVAGSSSRLANRQLHPPPSQRGVARSRSFRRLMKIRVSIEGRDDEGRR